MLTKTLNFKICVTYSLESSRLMISSLFCRRQFFVLRVVAQFYFFLNTQTKRNITTYTKNSIYNVFFALKNMFFSLREPKQNCFRYIKTSQNCKFLDKEAIHT